MCSATSFYNTCINFEGSVCALCYLPREKCWPPSLKCSFDENIEALQGHMNVKLHSWPLSHQCLPPCHWNKFTIGMFESPKCDVNPQPNTQGIRPLVGRTSCYRRSVMHVLAAISSITYNFSFICQCISILIIWSGREICPLLLCSIKFLIL